MTKAKGDRREREARNLYEEAGFSVETPNYAGPYTENQDYFNLFDGMAVRSPAPIRFYQVKSNVAAGIEGWAEWVRSTMPLSHVKTDFLVCHDREGWRLIRVDREGRRTAVDERETDGDMGEGVIKYLRGTDGRSP